MSLKPTLRQEIQLRQLPVFIGESRQAIELRDFANMVCLTEHNVLLCGETGTGKDHLAAYIHAVGNRRDRKFVDIQCCGIPEDLFESELFGHVKGAFTGANTEKTGLVETAEGGTLFLNEVGDASLLNQAKLLRVVERMAFRKVGGIHEKSVKARIISATNIDLKEAARSGRFRSDLYHRLNCIPTTVPPLRERKEDVPLFARYFLKRNQVQKSISPKAMEMMMAYEWPGNLRELKNTMDRASLYAARSEEVEPKHVKFDS